MFCKTVFPRFAPPDKAWRLEKRPKELVDALEEHAELLLQQLGSEVVVANLTGEQDSVAGQLLANCEDFATITARLAAYVPPFFLSFSTSYSVRRCLQLAGKLRGTGTVTPDRESDETGTLPLGHG